MQQQKQFDLELYSAHPDLRAQRADFSPLTRDQMLSLVPDEHTAVVEFALLHEAAVAFVLTRKGGELILRVHENRIQDTELNPRVEAFRKLISQRDPGYRSGAARLYQDLLASAEEDLRGKNTLVIVPDGILWRLPFAALVTPSGKHLLEERTIFYGASMAVLWEESHRNVAGRADAVLLAMGNPPPDGDFASLPNAETEVREIGKLYGGATTKVYTGAAAREERFKQEAGRYQVVHLATHGWLNDSNPMYSYVVLAHDPGTEDGLLEAREILNMNLRADVVVLSACQTAEGRISSGEGIVGMSWALQVAGTPATLVSHWSVDSASTTELMLGLHRRLHAQLQPSGRLTGGALALRDAALDLMRSPQYRHPYYWSAFAWVGAGY